MRLFLFRFKPDSVYVLWLVKLDVLFAAGAVLKATLITLRGYGQGGNAPSLYEVEIVSADCFLIGSAPLRRSA